MNAQPSTGHDARSLLRRVHRIALHWSKQGYQRFFPRPVALHVLVAGMQRSGTNLLMDVLDASFATQVFHETDPNAFKNYEMRERGVIGQLAHACPAPVFVIKALCELDQIVSLMKALGPAKTLWVVRGWRDSVNSAVKSFGNFVPQWKRLANGDSNGDWRGRGMSEATREVLRALYHPDAREIDGAAIMWYYRNILFFEQALERDPRVRLVFYEEMVQHPLQQVASIYEFLGLRGFNAGIASRIHAASVGRGTARGVAQAIAQLCDQLHARFLAAAVGRTT